MVDTLYGREIFQKFYFIDNRKFEEEMIKFLKTKFLSGFDLSNYPSMFIKFLYTEDESVIIVMNFSYKEFKKWWELKLLIRQAEYLSIGLSLGINVTIIISMVI